MYKYKETDDLIFLIGKELQQICYGRYDLQFNFTDELSFSVYSKVTLFRNSVRESFFVSDLSTENRTISLNILLGQTIIKYNIEDFQSLILTFSNKLALYIDGSEKDNECYTINYQGKLFVL